MSERFRHHHDQWTQVQVPSSTFLYLTQMFLTPSCDRLTSLLEPDLIACEAMWRVLNPRQPVPQT